MNLLKYTLLRFGIMIVVFLLCLWLHIGIIFGGVFAILISVAVCYLAFPRLHTRASEDFRRIFRRSANRKTGDEGERARADAAVEDDYVEEQLRREGREV